MATVITGKNGGKVVLLNPAEKGKKFSEELKLGMKLNNAGGFALDNSNSPISLTNEQRAFRSGYLSARSDSAKCYNAQQNKQATNKRSRNYRG